MVDMDLILRPNKACPVREIGDGLVIMAATGDMTHSLEEIGAFIWRQLDGRRNLDDIAAILTEEYEVSRKQAEADLAAFVEQLLDAGLVSPV